VEIPGTFETISELAIAITGFTGIVVAFAPDRMAQPSERFRLKSLLYWSLGTAFLAHLPGLLYAFPQPLPVWRLSHVAFALFHFGVFAWFFSAMASVRGTGSLPPTPFLRLVRGIVAIGAIVFLCEVAVAAGIATQYGRFFYHLALLWFLFLSAFSFAMLLLPFTTNPQSAGADES
jgi:hypothetical protein